MEHLQEIRAYLEARIEKIKLQKTATDNPMLKKYYEGNLREAEDFLTLIENKILFETI